MKRTVLVLLFAAAAQAASASVYKWVDANGEVHYGEKPPAAVGSSKQIALDKAPPPDPYAQERSEHLKSSMESAKEAREKRKEEQAKAKAEAALAKQNCATAKSRVHGYTSGGRLYRMDEHGERRYLSDDQRASELKQAQAEVKKWCK